ncbi:MAG TPA: hypothetical protein VLL25_04115, partial [Acidimicrobiales bacterium]|nr:hypothetical protein [Acidimicrobiales bacterium]
YRPSSILWDGTNTWVLLEGHPDDVAAQAIEVLGPAFGEVTGPPPALNRTHRLSLPSPALAQLAGAGSGFGWLAEVGVGTVHTDQPAELATAIGRSWPPRLDARVADLHRGLKFRFDPTGRLNPGREVAAT